MSSALEINFTGELGDDAASAAPAQPTPHLASVPTPAAAPSTPAPSAPQGPSNTPPRGLGEFEKAPIARSEIKLSGACAVNTNDQTLVSLDDRLRVVGEFRVTKVNHYVDKNGDVVRQHIVAPVDDLQLTPWDPADPNDDGIVRVRP